MGEYEKALEYYFKALAIREKTLGKEHPSTATSYHNIGALYYTKGDYVNAVSYLNKAVNAFEKIRSSNIPDANKIEYFASILDTYQLLIKTYIAKNEPDNAFNIRELSSAKYLIEKMAERMGKTNIEQFDIVQYRKSIPKNSAVISYANSTWDKLVIMVATSDKTVALEIPTFDFIKRLKYRYNEKIESVDKELSKNQGVVNGSDKEDKKDDISKKEQKNRSDFEKIINFYREYLKGPDSVKINGSSDFEIVSKEFYSLLIKPIEEYIKEKTDIIICPDGILGFIPFETLITPDNSYMIEKYAMSYSQSLGVLKIIDARKMAKNKMELLGFGGAVYDERTYQEEMKTRLMTKKELYAMLNRGSTKEAIRKLKKDGWSNLPGTLQEVEEINKLLKNSRIITGKSVTEANLKALSKSGELKKYKVIHFATHGLVVPEIPELSSIVLSLFKSPKDNEDGYLTMKEILGLDLECDFVNLSTCETGLGKITGGEGIVGLTQSFLLSGANGLSVSLWKVADESTMVFMVGLYKLVKEKKIGYREALIEMKRKFINDKEFASPYFWAPFVYYGR